MLMKILVTGGAGFIGKHLVSGLNKEHEVVVLDDLSRSESLPLGGVKGDVADYELVDSLVKDCDFVYHLAALSQVVPSIKNPDLCFSSNVLGTYNVAKSCLVHNKKMVFSSSREVYGEQEKLPVSELVLPDPKNNYGASKVAGEAIIKGLGINYTILRLSNVIGTGDKDRVVPLFIGKAMRDEEIVIYDETKIIDFVDVADVINAFIKALDTKKETYNVGSGISVRLGELATIIKEITNSKSKIIIKKGEAKEVSRYTADITKIKNELNWVPSITLKASISMIYDSLKHSF